MTEPSTPRRALPAGTPVTVTVHGTLTSAWLDGDAVALAVDTELAPLFISPGYIGGVRDTGCVCAEPDHQREAQRYYARNGRRMPCGERRETR